MAHIHEGIGEHDHTVSAFIVRSDFDAPKLLLHMHKKLHVLLQPGGHIELNENPWSALTHEINEESGYELSELSLLQPRNRLKSITAATLHPQAVAHNTHNFDHEGNHKHTDISYAFVVDHGPASTPHDGESADLRWLSLEELTALNDAMIYENVREIGKYVLSTVLTDWEQVSPTEYQA